jgi:signal transduction histidine kinase
MKPTMPNPSRALGRLVAAGALTLIGLVSASQMYFGYAEAGHPISAFDALGSGLMEWWLWAPLLPAVHALTRRFGFARERMALSLGVHFAASVLASLVEIVLFAAATTAIREWRFGEGAIGAELMSSFLFKLHTGVVTYWTAALGFLLWDSLARARGEAVRRAELERSLAEARLGALQSQLAPHFLFNTLNAISSVVRDDPDAAERMLARLGELLRTVLARRDRPAQPLAEELAFLDGYLELQSDRFGERLTIEKHVDPAALDADVPSFLLLPLVENALQHGIGARPGPGRLRIDVARRDGRVEIAIEDDGVGLARERDGYARSGLGLASARERLRLLHGDASRFELAPAEPRGAALRLSFPAPRA